ncbi:hypothetical protein CTAYLR_007586 [Chrysophaeum taylorii]|uniref:Ancillary SecYEG translocon subunit/Cell division coordinator CpoB TPR domain-containing protein n=1 Tax=Chrysophaeum taylorii TaxID=2483200 RepID=A0AAD7UG44_9STRA|nr:hypothetical protein CTAYLR_007586 [Chrysophaeum taylorii]
MGINRARTTRAAVGSARGQSKDAEGEYRAAVVAFEGNQEAHYQLGRFLAPGEEAERVLKRASTLGPTDPRPHWYLMKVMDHKGSLEGAVREARLYVRLGGDEGDERRLGSRELSIRFQKLAEALETRSNFDDAESCFSEAINADPSNSRAHCELGNLLYDVRNDDRGAERSYVAAIAADETALEPHVRLARIHARRGGEGLGKAVEHLELLLPKARQSGADTKEHLEFMREHVSDLESWELQIAKLRYHYGDWLFERRQTADAEREYDAASVHPELATTTSLCNSTEIFRARGDIDRAIASASAYRQAAPDDKAGRTSLAKLLQRRGRDRLAQCSYELSKADFQQALNTLSDADSKELSSSLYADLGDVSLSQGKLDTAVDAIRAAIDGGDARGDGRLRLGDVLCRRGEKAHAEAHWDDAEQDYRAALISAPRNARAHFDLGVLLVLVRKNLITGEQELMRALSDDDRKPHWFLAQVRELRGDLSGAVDHLDAFLKKPVQHANGPDFLEDEALSNPGIRRANLGSLRGDELRVAGDLPGAEVAYCAAIGYNETAPNPHWGLALVFEARGNLDRAIFEVESYLSLDPDDYEDGERKLVDLLVRHGKELHEQNHLDEAEAAYVRAIETSRAIPAFVHMHLAEIYEQRASLDKAIEEARLYIEAGGDGILNLIALLVARGKKYFDQENYDEAETDFLEAIDKKTCKLDCAEINLRLGRIYESRSDFSKAIAHVAKTDDKAWLSSLYTRRGDQAFSQGERDAAEADYRLASAAAPESPAPRCQLGALLLFRGESWLARLELRAAVKGNAMLSEPHWLLSLAALESGEPREALEEIARFTEKGGTKPNLASWTAQIHARAGEQHIEVESDYDAAEADFRRALDIDHGNATARWGLARVHDHRGALVDAIGQMRLLLKSHRNSRDGVHQLAGLLYRYGSEQFKAGDDATAKAAYCEAAGRCEAPSHVHWNLAQIHENQGNIREAIAEVRTYLELSIADGASTDVVAAVKSRLSRLHALYGDALTAVGEHAAALGEYESAILEDAWNAEPHWAIMSVKLLNSDVGTAIDECSAYVAKGNPNGKGEEKLAELVQRQKSSHRQANVYDHREPDVVENHAEDGPTLNISPMESDRHGREAAAQREALSKRLRKEEILSAEAFGAAISRGGRSRDYIADVFGPIFTPWRSPVASPTARRLPSF